MLSIGAQPFAPNHFVQIGGEDELLDFVEKHKDFLRTFSEEDLILFWRGNSISPSRLIEEDSSLPSLSEDERKFLHFHHSSLVRQVLAEKMLKSYLKVISFDPETMNLFRKNESLFTKMALIQAQFFQGLQREESSWFKQCSVKSKKGILRESIRPKHIASSNEWVNLDSADKAELVSLLSNFEDYVIEYYSQ